MTRFLRILIIFALLISGCGSKEEEVTSKTITNSVEVENVPADLSHYTFLEGELADYVEIPMSSVATLIKGGGSALIYFGYNTCDWCNRALPELNKVLLDYDFTTYYVDAHSEHYSFTKEDIDELYDVIYDTLYTDSSGEKGLFVPHVLGIKNGEIVGYHTSLVDSYHPKDISDPNDQMTEDEKKELQEIYRDIINKTVD